jgi:ATP-dependent Clp protease protease subunit
MLSPVSFTIILSTLFSLTQRIVRLGGAVDDDMANLLVAQLLYLDSSDQERDISMYVNSPGGSVTAGAPDPLVLFVWSVNNLCIAYGISCIAFQVWLSLIPCATFALM